MCVRALALWVSRLAVFALALAFTLSRPAWAQVFQWSDARGVIHFTDNASAIPESVKGSPQLIIRTDMNLRSDGFDSAPAQERAVEQPAFEPEATPTPAPSTAEPAKSPAPIIHYNPQNYTIVVINSVVRKPKKECLLPEGCKPVFQPSFDDRRFIHPSVFDGGSRQFIQPK